MKRLYDRALDALYPGMANWVHYGNGRDKAELLAAYTSLPAAQRAAWNDAVEVAFREQHGESTVMYRRLKGEAPAATSGLSVTTNESDALSAKHSARYLVHASDVLAHYAMADTPLASKAYGHEREVILRPENDAVLLRVDQNW